MRSAILLLLFLVCSFCLQASDSLNMRYGGVNRGFWVHLPPSYVVGQHLPVVFNFHGYGSFASEQEIYTQMDAVADTGKFIVVYPSGINAAWNVGWFGSFSTGPNDVGFTSAMIDTLIKLYAIDSSRVYSTGMSNGGFMSHLLACVLNNRIAAVAPVSGTVTDSAARHCNLTRKIPVMDIHGTNDPVVPYDTFPVSLNVEQSISFWLHQNQCMVAGDTAFLPNINVADSSTVQKIDYAACADGAEVLFYKIVGGGHTWPNGIIDIPVAQYGRTNRDMDANTEIWHFFNKYHIDFSTEISTLSEASIDIHIWPNPLAGNKLELSVPVSYIGEEVQVINASGNLIFKSHIEPKTSNVSLVLPDNMAAGIYLVRVIGENNSIVSKLLKL